MEVDIDTLPNFIMIDERQENPVEIIQDYCEMINELFYEKGAIQELLEMFFDDVNLWSTRQMLIAQAKIAISSLEQLDKAEHEFIEDNED